jgi:hypothetical protein
MLSLDQCRRCLPENCTISSSELELVRDQLYGLANVTVSAFGEQRRRKGPLSTPTDEIRAIGAGDGVGDVQEPTGFQEAMKLLPEDECGELEERAAINEFDGGLDRNAAERAAFCDYWRRKHKPKKD